MNMRKILAVLVAVLMLCTVIPMGALSVAAVPNDVVLDKNFDDGVAFFERGTVENGYLVFDATTADWQNAYQTVATIKANTDYVVTFKAMANKDAQLGFKINNDWTGYTVEEFVDVTTEWQDYELNINSGDLTAAIVMFTSGYEAANAPIYYIDDLKIVEYLDPALYGKVVNGDFESTDGWTLGTGASIVDGALQLDNPSQWSEAAMQTMYVKANTAYRMTWLSKRVSGTGAFNLFLMDGDNNNITVSGQSWMNETSGEWVLNTVNFTSLGEVLKIKFSTEGNDSGVILIDDVKVYEPPIIENADFETGDNTGWEIHQSTAISADAAHDGGYGAHLVGGGTYGGMLNQALSVEAGKNYEITFWLKVNANGVNVQLMDGDANGNKLAAGWFDTNSAGEWTQKVFIVTPTTDVIFVNFCGGGNNIAEDAYVDSFTAVELKDPSFDGYITNGDFETGRTGSWDPVWWAQNISIVEGGHNSDYAMQVNHDQWQLVRQKVTVEPNTNYVVSVYAKNASDVTLMVKDGNDSGNIAQAGIASGEDWTKTSLEFNSGDWTEVYIAVMGNVAGSTAIVDDFFMFEKPEASNDGYLINGTFETGSLTPWNNLWGSCPKAEVVRGGKDDNWALEIVSGQWKHVRQTDIAVEANTDYKITLWAKNTSNMSLLVKDNGDAVDIKNAGISAGDEWTEFVAEFNTGDYTSIIVSLMGSAEEAYGTFDNIVMEKVVPACEHEYEYDCSKVCSLCGEESRPEAEHSYFYACDQYCMNCGELTNPDADHSIVHVEAKAAVNCIEYGNKEYWYCEHCGTAWLDANLIRQTNMMSVRVAGECVSDSPACKDGVCVNCGLPCYAEAEHTYDNDYDADCNVCGEVREVELPEITYGDANGDGSINIRDVALLQQYVAGWEVTLNEAAADANGDGSVNIRDVALMQQYVAGWDVTLGG